jgi:hypothetical protein
MKLRTKLALAAIAVTWSGIYLDPVRRWMVRWGATDEEVDADLPGDGSIARPRYVSDKGITIAAEPRHVFPWLTQLGADRGGFYACPMLDGRFGVAASCIDGLLPADRHLRVGDIVPVRAGDTTAGMWVEALEADRTLVLRGTLAPGRPAGPGGAVPTDASWFIDWTWTFVLIPEGPAMTRLVTRVRGDHRGAGPALLRFALFEPALFAMERRMLLGIRELAERLAAMERGPAPDAASPSEPLVVLALDPRVERAPEPPVPLITV